MTETKPKINNIKDLILLYSKLKMEEPIETSIDTHNQISVTLNKTFTHTITNYGFGNLPIETVDKILKDGRPFSHFIELWLEENYPIVWVEGCKSYDFKDKVYPETIYDEKTFTKGGCAFCPSNMLGQGRSFNKEVFEEKAKKLVYCVVSNIYFPKIKVKFMRGIELMKIYPKGKIPFSDHIKFFD